jgi:hypothetical protein
MGREIKRVALDFDWPIGLTWKGYLNPYSPQECKPCGGSGVNPATKKISDDWYKHLRTDGKDGWQHHLEQADVDVLVAANRLMDFTHTWIPEGGWVRREDKYRPTVAEVNAWSRRGMGHDSINQWVCTEAKAKRLGVYGKCSICDGKGHYWCDEKYEKLSEEWARIEPPAGDGWQVWQTVSEGGPVTPVFPTAEALIRHLAEHGDSWDERRGDGGWGMERAAAFVGFGWAPSGAQINGKWCDSKDVALEAKK